MLFAHDTVASLRAAVELVNSGEEPDTLTTVAELDAWYAQHGYTGRRDGDEAELAALRALRPVLRELLTTNRDRAAELVNAMLAEAGALPQLVRHDGLDWHIHAVPADAPLDRRIVVESAMAMVDVIRADELSRLSLCADDRCERPRPRPLAESVATLLQHDLRQPQRGRGVPRPRPPQRGRLSAAQRPWALTRCPLTCHGRFRAGGRTSHGHRAG